MEFALVIPLLVLVLLALVQVAVVARTQLELVHAAREGARRAATAPDPAEAVKAVRAALGEPSAGQVRVSVRRPHVVGGSAEVKVVLPYRLATPLAFTIRLHARAVMRVER